MAEGATVRLTSFEYGRTQGTTSEWVANGVWNGGTVTPNYLERNASNPKRGTDVFEQGPLQSVTFAASCYPTDQIWLDVFPGFGDRYVVATPKTGDALKYESSIAQDVTITIPAGDDFVTVEVNCLSDGDITTS